MQKISVAVFAHNEAKKIERCLTHLRRNLEGFDYTIHVLANGCTDDTAARANALQMPSVRVHDLAIGDKANTWNHFVYDINEDAEHYIFTDGDCWVGDGSLHVLIDALETNPAANAAAAIYALDPSPPAPWTLNGCLYAVRGTFVRRLQEAGYKMPRGLVGDDGSLGHIVLLDLDPSGQWDYSRLVVCRNATFFADRFSPLTLAYWRNQHSRRRRYSLRHFENKMLDHVIRHRGIRAIPDTVTQLYRMAGHVCEFRWRSIDTPYDWRALRLIQGTAKTAEAKDRIMDSNSA